MLKPALITFLSSRPVSSIMAPVFHNGVPVFMLHRVAQSASPNTNTLSSDHLRKCLDYLVDRDYTFVSLENLIDALKSNQKLPLRSVVFTMDDGYLDQAETAASIALEYNCPITFFVVTRMLDQQLWPWDAKVSWVIESSPIQSLMASPTIKKLNLKFDRTINKETLRRSIQEFLKKSDLDFINETLQGLADDAAIAIPDKPPAQFQPMTWDMARTLEDQGVHFAPHSVSHSIMTKLDQASMEQEIIESWNRMKHELHNPCKVFCYPNGTALDFGNREIAFLKESGFTGAVSTISNVAKYKFNSDNYIYSLPRLPLPNNMAGFIQYCSWIERARALFT